MHSQTSFTDRQTNLYCFNNDLDANVNTCTSPTVEVDPLSSAIPTSSSVDLNSSFIDFVIANLSADEINRTGSTTNERDELPSDLEMAIRRLTNEELESIVQNQLQEIINRNCKATLLNNQIDNTNELMQKYKERITVLQKQVKELTTFVQTYMKNATDEVKSNPVKLTKNVGLQVGESSFLYEEQEKMEASLADVSTDEANRSTSTTPVNSKSPVNALKVRIDSSSPSLKDKQESLIIPDMVKLSTLTYEKQPKAIPSDYTQTFSEEIDLTLSDCETDQLLDVPSPQQLDELEEVAAELPVKRLITSGQSTCDDFISSTGSTGSSPTDSDNVATVQVEDTKKNRMTPSECNTRINSTKPTCPVKCIDQPPLNGISSSTDSFRSVGHVKPSVTSLATPLSSQSYLSSESIQSTEFIRPTGLVPSFRPTIAESISSTAAASASNSATTAPSRFDPPIQPLCSQLPCVHPSNNFTNHKEDPQFPAINLTNRKRRLPCSIDCLDPSTIASVEKHHKMIKKHWYDTQLVHGSNPSPTNSVNINNETPKPPLDSTKTSAKQSKEPIPFSINPRLFSKEIPQDDKKVDEPQVNNNMYHNWKIPCPNDAVKPDCPVRLPLKFKSYQPATNLFSNKYQAISQTKFKPFQRIPSFPQQVFPNPAQTPSTSQNSSIPQSSSSVCCNKGESQQFDTHVPVNHKNDNPLPAVPPLLYKRMPGNPSALEAMLSQPINNNFTRQPVFNWDRPIINQPFIRLEKVKEGILVVWTIPNLSSNRFEQAIYYDVFSRSESTTEQWKRIALIRALPLPMTCTFTKFIRGNCYSFRIRAILRNSVDGTTYEGPFSEPTCLRFS